ncbi:hypothetical protein DOTSEDRAFT_29576 [Dothistroma septosporum NZE10]|uniref:NAD(P)-binding protein n=1 Tax=Dothistroma septosporum (strain NZE10 / CBS 128990) TaxID=675120 RepID=N1PEH1_DOTSN|nr:hypothetical protein DOTSEDRAFT_29576 [Dothistroma septosporum NZE10]
MTIGVIWSGVQLYSIGAFTHIHVLHRSRLTRYKNSRGPASWALITGASDGIGRGFAEELLERGFNVVLHGRNRQKLENVRRALLTQWPNREVQIMVCDAGKAAQNPTMLHDAVQRLQKLNIRVLVNNVGGAARPLWVRLQDYSEANARSFLDVDCRFMTDLTRLMLPKLIASQPALIINIGSFVSDLPAPYISVLGGAKAYGKAWSRSLALEMKLEGNAIEVMYVQVGMVSTPNDPRPISLLVPSAREMASTTLDKVGCGRSEVYGYWPHELHACLLIDMPGLVREPLLMRIVKQLKQQEEAEMKDD